MSFFNLLVPEHLKPTLSEIEDHLLYNRHQARHALGLGEMQFEKAVRKLRLKRYRDSSFRLFLGADIKEYARNPNPSEGVRETPPVLRSSNELFRLFETLRQRSEAARNSTGPHTEHPHG